MAAPEVIHDRLEAPYDRPYLPCQLLTGRSQADTAGVPDEQPRPDLPLQPSDVLTDGRLGHVQPTSGATEVERLGDGQKGP